MLAFRKTMLGVLAPALVAACGARSTLEDIDSAGGSGGAGGGAGTTSSSGTTTSSSSTTSTTGTGGAPLSCPGFVQTDPAITLPPTPADNATRPALVPATDDGSLVSVVFARQPLLSTGPALPPMRIAQSVFAPWGWGSWPAGLPADHQIAAVGGETFAASSSLSADPGVAALFCPSTGPSTAHILFSPFAPGDTDHEPYPPGPLWPTGPSPSATALARGASDHLALYQWTSPGYSSASVAVLKGPLSPSVFDSIACATTQLPGAAAATQDGYLVATASSGPPGSCLLDDDIPGPANRVLVLKLVPERGTLFAGTDIEEPDPIAHVKLARRESGGAWLVWQNSGASALTPPPIRALRLDEDGAAAGPVIDVTSDGEAHGPVAAAALGDRLAVAWMSGFDPSLPNVHVDLFDETGNHVDEIVVATGQSWFVDPSLSLLASPDRMELLLAWSDIAPSGNEPAVVRVARILCGFI